MKRLRLGVSLSIARNTLVYARNVSAQDIGKAESVISGLAFFGFRDGLRIGSGLLGGTIVARLEDN